MTHTTADRHPTLVTSGTGKTGSRVVTRLRAAGRPVRIGSRAAEIPFDWADRGTWPAALSGVRTVYLAFQPDLAVPGAPEVIRAFTAAAAHAGVRKLVLLSGRGEPEAARCERIVRESGLNWTWCAAASSRRTSARARSPATRWAADARSPTVTW
ncbi:SDR family oxidoreductase, partial [Nocardia niwae]